MALKKTSIQQTSGGIQIQLNLVSVIIFSFALMVSASLVTYGLVTIRSRDLAAASSGVQSMPSENITVEDKNPGAWGQLNIRKIDLEQPDEYLAYETTTNKTETWTFAGMTPQQVRALMQSAGVAAGEIDRALSPALVSLDNANTVVRPDDELVFSLSPSARAKLYSVLGQFGQNELMHFPFCFPGNTFDTWFTRSELGEATLSQLKKLIYPRGDAQCFSDLQIMLRRLPDEKQRLQLVKSLS